jgi:hypothetical protein
MRSPSILSILLVAGALAVVGCDKSYEFEGVSVGQDDTRAPKARSNSQYIRAIYADLLGRAPEAFEFVVQDGDGNELLRFPIDEQEMLVGALEGINDPDALRAMIAAGLVASAEVDLPDKSEVADPAAFVVEQFHALLGREPNAYELATFVAEWKADPAVNPRTVVRAILGSREYQSQ